MTVVTKPVPVPAFMELTNQWREPYDNPERITACEARKGTIGSESHALEGKGYREGFLEEGSHELKP